MNSPFGWPGGKRNLLKCLLQLIPSHTVYVEVFSGSAKLLFGKPVSECEIVNDINDDVVNFFRVAKHRPAELAECLEREIVASTRFKELRADQPAQSEIERALRFIYLTWFSFGSKGEHFASATVKQLEQERRPVRKSLDLVRRVLNKSAERLRSVLIEQRDFADCIRRFDSKGTFFYCDPPYTSFGRNARYESLGDRQRELFEILSRIRGKFLLSFDDAEPIRELAGKHGFQCQTTKVTYTLAAHSSKKAGELLISNYKAT